MGMMLGEPAGYGDYLHESVGRAHDFRMGSPSRGALPSLALCGPNQDFEGWGIWKYCRTFDDREIRPSAEAVGSKGRDLRSDDCFCIAQRIRGNP